MTINFFRKPVYNPKISVNAAYLLILSSLAIFLLTLFMFSTRKEPLKVKPEMVKAARTMQRAIDEIREYRREKKIPINSMLDPNHSGFIGEEFTPITTTLGNIEAKQTAVNPDFAALVLRWFSQIDLQPGDRVALQFSGSFPSLNIAAIIACEVLQLEPLISSSVGASSYGANIPQFTYPDMENRLYTAGIIHHKSEWVTPGGNDDNGSSFWKGGDLLVRRAARQNGYVLKIPESLQESIKQKISFFRRNGPVKAFVNIGGNQAALGNCPHSPALPTGLITAYPACRDKNRGLIMNYFEQNIPVIHLLDVRSLAKENGLPIAPHPLPEPGSADVYFRVNRSKSLALISVITLFALMILLRRRLKQPLLP